MKKILSFLLCICILTSLRAVSYADYNQIDEHEVDIVVNGKTTKGYAIEASYKYNTYLSLRSLAEALSDTDKKYDISYGSTKEDGQFFEIETQKEYKAVERENDNKAADNEDEAIFLQATTNRLFFNGQEKKYYTFRYADPEDLYMALTDVQLLFDIGMAVTGYNEITVYPERTFAVDLSGLEQEGYFNQFNAVLSGTKDGKISFSVNPLKSIPVASTSKLMSYLIIAEALKDGKANISDYVTISKNVALLAKSEDGRLEMKEGNKVPLSELIDAMLVMSSNEATLAIAEHIYGSENAFVDKMNERSKELKLTASKFYNCNGLPVMTAGSIPTKLQNRMSAKDLFTLSAYLLNNYPEITDITSKQLVKLNTLDYASWNSNTLVFNIDNVTGLKTGSTKASGSCVVACDSEGQIVIVLGAEDSAMRGRAAEILFRAN